ncbi:reverse transcriptase domain-containing protein [Tanacetum coccineum]|uniref:Reverse transcriptase domain-containing protein n=1 Tax=Tanacetum coccineum TaxID=301880 RepID=A0ABQ5B7W6_9ASTR
MSFGLCNAPGTFQRCMVAIFHDMIEKTHEVFHGWTCRSLDIQFSSCLPIRFDAKWCEDTNLVLNWEKCHFMAKEGIVLGHKISKSGIEVDRAKVDVIVKLPPPTWLKARPITHLMEKDTPFFFSPECQSSFEILKKKLTEAPILVSPDWDLPFELMCDASDFAVGAVLGQRKDKYFRPIHSCEVPELLLQLLDDLRTINESLKQREEKRIEREQAANLAVQEEQEEEAAQSFLLNWNFPMVDDDEYTIIYRSSKLITPDLPTEEPDTTLSMGDEHLDTNPETESDEVIKFSVENLVPIPRELEGISNDSCDVPFYDNYPPLDVFKEHFELFSNFKDDSNNDNSFENIDYIEASSLEDSLIIGNEELSSILEKELDEFVKSSVEDLVPIPSESED